MTDEIWDSMDTKLDLRESFAKLVASKVSGIHPDTVCLSEEDLAMADQIGRLIETEVSSVEVDVQLAAFGVFVAVGGTGIRMNTETFLELAKQIKEAEINSRGYDLIEVEAKDIVNGDRINGWTILNIRVNYLASDLTRLNLSPFGHLVVNTRQKITVERSAL